VIPEEIYQALKNKIIWLDFAPESICNISEIAESYGVSRTPIKEILILLQAEGWLLRNGSRFMVTPLSINRIREITEIRSVMEVQANIWALQRITAEELTALDNLKSEIANIDDTAGNRHMIELDCKVHHILFNAAKNDRLTELLVRLLSHYLRYWLSITREIVPKLFFAEVLEMIQAIEEKDEERVRNLSITHIEKSQKEIVSALSTYH